MSKELPKQSKQNEEIDLIVFFSLIGKAFNKVFCFFKGLLKSIFSLLINALKVLLNSWKIIFVTMFIAGVLGYFLEKTNPVVYSTNMLVEPYYNSKYQLVTNINYFNALIDNNDVETLKNIFEVNDDIINEIKGFKIEPGPETENDRILQYESFKKKLDSLRAQDFSYEEFLENRSVYSGNYFLITASAYKADIFKDLEKGILSSFSNDFTRREKEERDTLIEIQKENLKNQLKQVDSLQKIYIKVLETESESKKNNVSLGELSISSSDKQNTKEYELLKEEQRIRDDLRKLDQAVVQEKDIYSVISSFQKVGNKTSSLLQRYSLIFPLLAFLLIVLFFLAKKVITFTLNYED